MDRLKTFWNTLTDPDKRGRLTLVLGVLASLGAGSWAVYIHFLASSDESVARALALHGFAVEGDVQIHGDLQLGITLHEYEASLRRREAELRREFATTKAKDAERRELLRAEIEALQERLGDISGEYEALKARLGEAAKGLGNLDQQFGRALIDHARKALLTRGDTALAEDLFQQALDQRTTQSAEAARQLGLLAEVRSDVVTAWEYYNIAVDLAPNIPAYLQSAGRASFELGRYAEAEVLLKRSIELYEKRFGVDHALITPSLMTLARLYRKQERFDEATTLSRRSLDLVKGTLGTKHAYVAEALNSLAAAYEGQGRDQEAEPLYKRSLEILKLYEGTLGHRHPLLGTILNNLATLYRRQERYQEAERLFTQSLEIATELEQELGKQYPLRITTLNNLALLYMDQRRDVQAKKLLMQSLSIMKNGSSSNNAEAAVIFSNLAQLYQRHLCYEKARQFFEYALERDENTFGPDSPKVAERLMNLARLYEDQDRYVNKTLPLLKRALRIRENAFGPDDLAVAEVYLKKSEVTLIMALQLVSLEHYQFLDRIESNDFYSESDWTISAEVQGLLEISEKFLKRSLQITENIVETDDVSLAPLLSQLAEIYRNQLRYDEAETLFQRSLHLTELNVGREDPKTASRLRDLVSLYIEQDRYEEAAARLDRSVEIIMKRFGRNSREMGWVLGNFASLYGMFGRYEEAEALSERSLNALGYEDPMGPRDLEAVVFLLRQRAVYLSLTGREEDSNKIVVRVEAMSEMLRVRVKEFCETNGD